MQFDAVKHLANALDAHDQATKLNPNPHELAVREALLAIASASINTFNRTPAKTLGNVGISTSGDIDNRMISDPLPADA
ncbi:MAG: hypothetical protein LLG14_03940 [Nocardiaceae bacterium]|nr:hypothetical protein [Nocardiaceae bacterium]